MNDKIVTLPIAERLREVGWVKRTEWCWYLWQTEPGEYNLRRFDSSFDLQETDYFAPDLFDITREIRKSLSEFDDITSIAYKKFLKVVEHFNGILWKDNEVDTAAEIWIEMKQEGL